MTGLHTYRWGSSDRPAVLLLHGLTEAGTAWPDLIRRWQGTYHLVAVDLRGHGRSPRFDDAQLRHSHEVWLADIVDVLSTMEVPPVVVAHSLGGLFALRAADVDGSLVRGLVLEDPAQPTGDPVPDPDFVAHQEAFLDAFADGGHAERVRIRAETHWTLDEIDEWAACKPLVDRRMIRDGLHLGDATWEPLFDRLTVPTLVVVPRDGEMAPDESTIVNPLVRFQTIDGVGHCVRRDNPDAYHAVVDPFVAGLTADWPAD